LRFAFDLRRDWHLIAGFVGFESPFCVGCHFEVGRSFEHRMGERRAEVAAVAGTTEVWGSRPVFAELFWYSSSEWIFSLQLVVFSWCHVSAGVVALLFW